MDNLNGCTLLQDWYVHRNHDMATQVQTNAIVSTARNWYLGKDYRKKTKSCIFQAYCQQLETWALGI